MSKEVYLISAARTPIGSFGGSLAGLSATQLGGMAVREALRRSGLGASAVNEVLMGNVLSAGLGQAPATQVAVAAGLGYNIPASVVNKVCASGMKAIMIGAQSIQTGHHNVVIAGGMESMSNVPYYLNKARTGYRYGNGELADGLVADALTDAYNHCAMGVCADNTAKERGISREDQDAYAIATYQRSAEAWAAGRFGEEVFTVEVPQRKGDAIRVTEDEEYRQVKFDKIPGLKPVFSADGSVTAANASTLNDGAAAVVLASEATVKQNGIQPLAKIIGYADAAQDPMWFTTAPAKAIPMAIRKAGLQATDVDCYEINEAFSAVALANLRELNLNPDRVNMNGGAVSLGHPLGASGARIVVTLIHVMRQNGFRYGVAGICNGGGGASALVLENCF